MTMWRPRHAATVAALIGILGFDVSHAQSARSGGGGEAQKFMQQYQQLAAEKTALQAQAAQMKKDLDAAKADLAAMKKERDALKARSGGSAGAVAQAVSAKQAAEQSLEQSKQRINELVGQFRETARNLKEVETDRNKARKALDERNAAFDGCAENNLQLYEISEDVLKRYERVGPFTKISAAEPFTKLTRTRIENLVGDYRQRALELRVKPAKP
jgi:chromosome segregation ATPase